MDINDLKKRLVITNNLDMELIEQPMVFFEVADAHAMAVAERDTAEEALARVDAEQDAIIRAYPEKTTEAAIKNKILLSEEHIEAVGVYLEKKKMAARLEGLRKAFEQRSPHIRDACRRAESEYSAQTSFRPAREQFDRMGS